MAEATNTHDYFQLSRLSRWHVESDTINQALAMVIEAQSRLPMAKFWGGRVTASSDGQLFPAARQGEAMNLINAKYGSALMSDNHLGRCRQPPWPVGLDGRRACPSGGQPHRPD